MVRVKHRGIWTSIAVSLAMILAVALAGAGTALAQNTVYGTNACGSTGSCGTGSADSVFGYYALYSNTTGNDNTASGYQVLYKNTTGYPNTAEGYSALYSNTTGDDNVAIGYETLYSNTTANDNVAVGDDALHDNTTATNNVAVGSYALDSNSTSTASYNTAAGFAALENNTSGALNTGLGWAALNGVTGGSNIGIGASGGYNLTSGSYDIDIGNHGVAAESDVIRIGVQGTQTDTYIAGIDNDTQTGGTAVYVNSNGLLFIHSSSARYKRDINDMGNASSKLMKLRPVTFRYKNDQKGTEQYGLIAEEVERVYPEMVEYGAKGEVEGVHYDVLPAMLLNEMQKQVKQNRQLAAQVAEVKASGKHKDAQIALLKQQIDGLKKKDAQIDALNERMNTLERQARAARPEHLASAMP